MKLRSDFLQIGVDWIVSNAEYILIRATPILSPIPSAFALTHALRRAEWQYAGVVGGIIEAIGMGAGVMIAYISAHNQRHPNRQISPKYGYIPFGFYVALAIALIFGYETLPVWAEWYFGTATPSEAVEAVVPLLFPGLTLIGAVIIALREYMRKVDFEAEQIQKRQEATENIQRSRENAEFDLELEIKRRKAEQQLEIERLAAEQKRQIEQQKVDARLSKSVQKSVQSSVKMDSVTPDGRQIDDENQPNDLDKLLDIYRDKPKASLRFVGGQLGKSPQTISNWLDRLEEQKIIHRNGHGVEILG